MPRRTQVFKKIPWTGGVNSSVDQGVLPVNDLVQADNVVFTSAATRTKRQGFDYFDTSIPAVVKRSSSGVTRTLVFTSSLQVANPFDQILVVGEPIMVTGSANANYNGSGTVASISTTTVANDTLTYTFSGAAPLTEATTAETAAVVTKNWLALAVHDFWYFSSANNAKQQYRMAASSAGQLFRYDENGRRKLIPQATIGAIPATLSRSSSGYNRTLVFASSIAANFAVNDEIVVTSAGNAAYNTTDGVVLSLGTTNIANDTITYTFVGGGALSEALIAETAAVVTYYTPKTATALVQTPLTRCDLRTFANKLVWSMNGVGNTPKYYNAARDDFWYDVPGAPDFSIMQEHQGRLFTDDKKNVDSLQFCAPFDLSQWQGIGDSGTLPLGQGDGDPVGISTIMPPFRDQLFVGKGAKLWRIDGDAPETYNETVVSSGLGSVAHRAAVAFDMDDLYFASQRGFHSIITTQQFGDFLGKFLSKRIQPTFNLWNHSQFQFMQGTYVSPLNSAAWCVAEPGNTSPNAIWLFNPTVQNEDDGSMGVWYRWPSINAQSVSTVLQDGYTRLFCGTSQGRVLIGQNLRYTDYGTSGIPYRVKTGAIYVDGDTNTIKAFKKFGVIFKPQGRFNFTAYFKVDNFPPQAVTFTQTSHGDKLGQSFVLGSSVLGSAAVLAPFMKDVIGHGRGCSIEIFQTGVDAQVEIYGFAIEFESADTADEVIQEL